MLVSKRTEKGYLILSALIFSSVLLTIIVSLIGLVTVQSRLVTAKLHDQKAGHIAEAGLEYYKWYLAHNPGDFTHGTGGPGPYEFIYYDTTGEAIGEYHITVETNQLCGQTTTARIVSVGFPYENSSITRQISARYARPTVADYSYIVNSNAYLDENYTFSGLYHTNSGVHMNADHQSQVSSSLTDWECGNAYGCAPTSTVDGVYTSGTLADSALFRYPVPTINFGAITQTLNDIKTLAQSQGIYIGPTAANRQGYHLVFLPDGRMELRRVNGKENEPSGYAWGFYLNVVKNSQLLETYDIPADCPVIFVEDQIWVEGTINGKVTLGVADLVNAGVDQSMIINNNLLYANADSRLLAVVERDVIVGLEVPDDTVLNGVFVAGNGQFRRNETNSELPASWASYAQRNSLTINGSIMSNGPVITKWQDGTGAFISGFNYNYHNYDRSFAIDPPPLLPHTSDNYQFFEWRDGE